MEQEKQLGSILRVRRFPASKMPDEVVPEGRFVAFQGMEGDHHADGGPQQITLLGEETQEKIAAMRALGNKIEAFRENLLTRGIDLSALKIGDRLAIGSAQLEITGAKQCDVDRCTLLQRGIVCPLVRYGVYARVIKTGRIAPGDKICRAE